MMGEVPQCPCGAAIVYAGTGRRAQKCPACRAGEGPHAMRVHDNDGKFARIRQMIDGGDPLERHLAVMPNGRLWELARETHPPLGVIDAAAR